MALTIPEIKEKLIEQVDEIDFVDFLGLTTEDLVSAFADLIEEDPDRFLELLDFEDEDVLY